MKKFNEIINSSIITNTDLIEEYVDCHDDLGESLEEFVAKFDLRRMLMLAAFYGDYDTNQMIMSEVTVKTVIKSDKYDGQPVSFVFLVSYKDESIYVRLTGRYSSYDGTEWDNEIEEVFPVEVMVTKFKRADGYVYKESM
jgi:hypothetical protein